MEIPPPSPPEDRRLLAAFQRGDRSAFDTLFDRYAGRVLAFALTLTGGCRADAEDLVQETFVAAYRGADGFRGGARLLTWLLGILARRHRDNRRRLAPPFAALCEETEAALETDLATRTAATLDFRQALNRLDTPLREAFLLVAGQGRTHKEAATILGIPEGTAKWRVAEATRRLRAALTEHENEPITPTLPQR